MKFRIVATILVLVLAGSLPAFAQEAQEGATPVLFTSTPVTNQLIVTIEGQAPPFSFVEVFRNDRSLGLAYTNQEGKFSLITYLEETETGINVFRARTAFSDGSFSELSPALYITLDLVPPLAPLPESTSVILEPTQFLYGSAEPGSRVFVLVDSVPVKDVPADENGRFSTGSLNLSPGWHDILYYAQDQAGNQSAFSPLVVAFVQEIPSQYAQAMTKLSDLGIMQGYPDGTMRPLNKVTRAEFATFLARVLTKANYTPPTSPAAPVTFSDLPPEHWAYQAVEFVSAQGLMKGFPDGTFRPEEYITGKEVIAALVRAAGLEREAQAAQAYLKDAPWFAGYSVVGAQHGLLYPDFAPEEEALRGEVAISLSSLYDALLLLGATP
ncbi:MAG: S-layer homology domain-containing protein [Coprothermobacterota bacterium]|nr:S-layer homology domain-containing protein [Coprothermobacterota bacterium]